LLTQSGNFWIHPRTVVSFGIGVETSGSVTRVSQSLGQLVCWLIGWLVGWLVSYLTS